MYVVKIEYGSTNYTYFGKHYDKSLILNKYQEYDWHVGYNTKGDQKLLDQKI